MSGVAPPPSPPEHHPAHPVGSTELRDVRVDILCPIDIDFEPDVERLAKEDQSVARLQPGPGGAPAIETPRVPAGQVSLGGRVIAGEAMIATRIYRFGTGIVRVSFQRDACRLADLAPLAAATEQVTVGGKTVLEITRAIAADLRAKLLPYAIRRYEGLLLTTEAYPVFRVGALAPGTPGGDAFLASERRALAAIVGVPGRVPGRLGRFALETASLRNMDALEGDVVVVREAGAFLHVASGPRETKDASEDAKKIEGLIELGYAQYWSLHSVDDVIQRLQDHAYDFIAKLEAGGAGGLIPVREVLTRLYRAREEHMAVSGIVDDFLELPAIGYDIYMDEILHEVQRVFRVDERSRLARDRLEDLERSFEIAHHIIAERRLLTIEVLVLLVIVLELLIAIFGKH